MSRSPQDVYARYLVSSRGYPLWIPEPTHQVLQYRPDGLRIGDVGVVVPEDGGFEVFFNICLPREHPFHRASGVPDNFEQVELRDEDIRLILNVENSGRIISSSSVTKRRTVEPSGDTPGGPVGGLGYEFDLSSSGGAILILPEGAERRELRNHHLFYEEATRHGVDWYRFAEERLGRMISHDSLYLITGFYKARSWSLAAFENMSGSGEFSAQFKMAHVGGGNIAGTYTWETTSALDWRVGPVENYGIPNQSVFIRGFRIALRTGFLGKEQIKVEVGAPNVLSNLHGNPLRTAKRGSLMSKVFKGFSKGGNRGTGLQDGVTNRATSRRMTTGSSGSVSTDDGSSHVVVQPMPEASHVFHPSDIINQYLLSKEPSANVAVTHDDAWISMLRKGQLKPEDFVQADSHRIEAALCTHFRILSAKGVVSLEGDWENGDVEDIETEANSKDGRQSTSVDEEAPPPSYTPGDIHPFEPMDMSEKPKLKDLFFGKSLRRNRLRKVIERVAFAASTPNVSSRLHWLLSPYDPERSKRLLRFDIIFPVDRIRYQHSNNVHWRLSDEDLDEPASGEAISRMKITFEQRPFSWTMQIDNPKGIRCRHVFDAVYNCFNQQLTLGELWRIPDRATCEQAFRRRTLVLGHTRTERALGWKRVDVLLHHTVFQGLTRSPNGDWALHLGAPLPVPRIAPSFQLPIASSLPPLRRDSSSAQSDESSDELSEPSSVRVFASNTVPAGGLALPAMHAHRDAHSYDAKLESDENAVTRVTPPITAPGVLLLPEGRIRPARRPLGPRTRPTHLTKIP